MTILEQLEKEDAAFQKVHEAIKPRAVKGLDPIREQLKGPDINSDIAREIGRTIYKVIPSLNSKRETDIASSCTVGKRIGFMYESNKYGAPDRAANVHRDRLFWYLQEPHINLVKQLDKREALRDFFNLCTAIKTKTSDEVVELKVNIPVTAFEVYQYSYNENTKDRNSLARKFNGVGKRFNSAIDMIRLELPSPASGIKDNFSYAPSKHKIKDAMPSCIISPILKAYTGQICVGTMAIGSNAFTFDGDRTESKWGHMEVCNYLVNEWDLITGHPDVHARINEWLDVQRLATKAYGFLRKKYSKQLFLAEL